MAIIVEDGSIVAGANSYITIAGLVDFLDNYDINLPNNIHDQAHLLQAKDVLESLWAQYKGEMVDPATQSLQWPRKNADLFGELIPETTIPQRLIDAQCWLAYYDHIGYTLEAISNGKIVLREKVDVIEREYADQGTSLAQPIFKKVDNLLAPLLNPSSLTLTTIRV